MEAPEAIREYFRDTKDIQVFLLWSPIIRRYISNCRAIMYGLDPYQIKFHGLHPLTGLPVTIVFNEPSPGRRSVLSWNPLLESWMHSDDAGLTWQRVEFADYIEKVDCLLSEPKYP